MLFTRMYDTKLAQASYLIGCQRTGEAIVVDPNRDVTQYLRAAAAEGVRVTHVTETHIHADFVSGSRELAQRTGAQLLLSDAGGADWSYGYAAGSKVRLLHDHDVFMVGNVRFDVLHTPGHTPEHLSFMVTDTPAGAGAMGVLTGDFVFVGDVGRPDLLEKAAHLAGTMEASARTLFRSLQRFKRLPDHLQLWPGHGAGSACGKSLGAVPTTTLGYEKVANWGLASSDEQAFVDAVLAGQPEPPTYFAEMKRVNREGPAIRGDVSRPARLDAERLARLLRTDARIVDARSADLFAARSIPGTISIPLGRSFSTWAGWLLPYHEDVYLIVDAGDAALVDGAVHDLAMIGIDRVAGYWTSDVIDAHARADHPLQSIPQLSVEAVADAMAAGTVTVIDVRAASEHEAGHVPGARNIPVGLLADRLAELPTTQPVVLHCQGGARSMIAASVLRAHGVDAVVNMTGGLDAWTGAGLPLATPSPAAAPTAH